MNLHRKTVLLLKVMAAPAVLALSRACLAADATAAAVSPSPIPAWLTDLSLADKETYDDNVLLVSGLGMPIQQSWVNIASFRLGVDLASLLNDGGAIQTLSLAYQPDIARYEQASQENYTAHRFNTTVKGKSGNITYSLDNSFLYNDGSKLAETYALNQLSGSAGNQNDKYRNNYTHTVPRERRNQDQDRYTALVQDNFGSFFFRPISNLTYYNLNTAIFNTSFAPYKGYQDYVDRWDVNAGADLGYQLTSGLAFTVGYRDGYQHQDQFSLGINSDQHYSSNHYQRVLAGLEGKVAPWLTVKLSAGPDVRSFNPNAPIVDLHTTRLYAEGSATATLAQNQTLTLAYKQWIFASSTGLVPYIDTTASAVYHLNVTKQLGLDLGARFLEANYTLGDDLAGSAPSLRDDLEYEGSVGLSYAIIPHLIGSVTFTGDKGENGLETLAATYAPAYRNFNHTVTGVGLQYKF